MGNSITGRAAENMHGAYGGNYERLARIKKKHDPANLFADECQRIADVTSCEAALRFYGLAEITALQ
jgi:Berberine and berberine like